jgi:ribonuclease P protein component
VDVSFAALSRRRPDLTSTHFGLAFVTGVRRTVPDPALLPADAKACSPKPPQPALGFAVPKRLVKGAVERNALKRVAREAWRAAAWSARHQPVRALVKLRRAQVDWKQMPMTTLKKVWRAELDELLARLDRRDRKGTSSAASSPVRSSSHDRAPASGAAGDAGPSLQTP